MVQDLIVGNKFSKNLNHNLKILKINCFCLENSLVRHIEYITEVVLCLKYSFLFRYAGGKVAQLFSLPNRFFNAIWSILF